MNSNLNTNYYIFEGEISFFKKLDIVIIFSFAMLIGLLHNIIPKKYALVVNPILVVIACMYMIVVLCDCCLNFKEKKRKAFEKENSRQDNRQYISYKFEKLKDKNYIVISKDQLKDYDKEELKIALSFLKTEPEEFAASLNGRVDGTGYFQYYFYFSKDFILKDNKYYKELKSVDVKISAQGYKPYYSEGLSRPLYASTESFEVLSEKA